VVTDADISKGAGLGSKQRFKAPASAASASVPAGSVSMSHDSGVRAPASCHDVAVFPSWMLLRRLLLRPLQYILMFRITFEEDTL